MSEKTADKVISIENLSKSFGDHQVCVKLTLPCQRARLYAL